MIYTLYQIRNEANSKLYIGITQRPLRQRFLDHLSTARRGDQKPLYVAMREIGLERFFIEAVETVTGGRCEALSRETSLIKERGTAHPMGYNLSTPLTDEQAAIIKYNFYCWPKSKYARVFGVSNGTVALIQSKNPFFALHVNVTRENLPSKF